MYFFCPHRGAELWALSLRETLECRDEDEKKIRREKIPTGHREAVMLAFLSSPWKHGPCKGAANLSLISFFVIDFPFSFLFLIFEFHQE